MRSVKVWLLWDLKKDIWIGRLYDGGSMDYRGFNTCKLGICRVWD